MSPRLRLRLDVFRRSLSTQRPYLYHIAADWAGKPPLHDAPTPPKVFLSPSSPIGLWSNQSLKKMSHSTHSRLAGEDFLFYTNMRQDSGVSLGVADGVGGWSDQGIDSSVFSRALMYYSHLHFQNGWAGEPEFDPAEPGAPAVPQGTEMTPSECLRLAYQDVLADDLVEAGSSTACLVSLNASSGMLRSANLGDSGFFIIRSSSIFYRSRPQTHYFNCPRQLAKLRRTRGRNHADQDSIADFPSAAQNYSTKLRDGDIIIIYTDGLSDNVFEREILQICALAMSKPNSEMAQVQLITQHLIHYARACMFSDRVSPFELEARQHRKFYPGGKIDDVSVVVALVKEAL